MIVLSATDTFYVPRFDKDEETKGIQFKHLLCYWLKAELPLVAVTALLGTPFFALLLCSMRRSQGSRP